MTAILLIFHTLLLSAFSLHASATITPSKSGFISLTTAAQFSGAIQVAHKQNILGKNLTAIIMETLPLIPNNHGEMPKNILVLPNMYGPPPFDHAKRVTRVLLQTAPEANILLAHNSFNISSPAYSKLSKSIKNLDLFVRKSLLINMSFGPSEKNIKHMFNNPTDIKVLNSAYKENLRNIIEIATYGEKKLVVIAAGNERSILSHPIIQDQNEPKLKIDHFSHEVVTNKALKNHMIIVGSLSQDFSRSTHSNYPGEKSQIQENLIYTLGEDIPFPNGSTSSGTSFAAPIVSGCALLIKEKYPTLTMLEVKEALLESASKNFFINKGVKDGKIEGVFVYESAQKKPDLQSFPKEKYSIRIQPFNPRYYGCGVLDLRAAFIYAKIREKNKSLPKEVVFEQMSKTLELEDHSAAKKIQSAFRDYQIKKTKEKPNTSGITYY